MHSYSVEFRIISEENALDLDAITNNIGLVPNNTRHRGEAKSAYRAFEESMWGYAVYPDNSAELWDSLEEGIETLLKVFMPLKEKIREYALKYDVVIWCGHFTSSFDGGPTFSPEILQKLADLSVELYLDTYCYTEEGQANEKLMERG